jgi:hypothetical protein
MDGASTLLKLQIREPMSSMWFYRNAYLGESSSSGLVIGLGDSVKGW